MPPRCCTGDCISPKFVNYLFNDDFKRIWNQKFAEAASKASEQKVCPRAKCRARIRAEDIFHHNNGRTSASCHKCGTRICGICFQKWHESRKCPVDAGEKAGWKKCRNCQANIQWKEGCSHMTCPCGAQFCTLCELKWKTCDCPWFDCESEEPISDDEADELEHMQMPVPGPGPVPVPAPSPSPAVGRGRFGRMDGPSRGPLAGPSFGTRRSHRMLHVEEDFEDDGEDDVEDDGYIDDFVDVMALGSASGRFMSDDFRRSHSTLVPPAPTPPVPLPPASVATERANAGANYVSGVNRARGLRNTSSMERLAGRFSGRHTPQRSLGQPPMSPPMHHAPTFGHAPPRHTMNDEVYDMPLSAPFPPPMPRSLTYDYMDDTALHPSRRPYPGLTGPGSGMHRVYEWRNYVDSQTVT
ncbi:hypothetical protein F5Y17DRAFT_467763 [Xylariaceae sp. FL0594]|nr:hypothetical protein F5Y17DRAFT_467763 [Xylariaceae sp. FL0594]